MCACCASRAFLTTLSLTGRLFLLAGTEVTVDMEANTLTDHSTGKTYNLQPIGDVSEMGDTFRAAANTCYCTTDPYEGVWVGICFQGPHATAVLASFGCWLAAVGLVVC